MYFWYVCLSRYMMCKYLLSNYAGLLLCVVFFVCVNWFYCFGVTEGTLKYYSWLSAQKLLLMGFGEPYTMPGIEPMPGSGKTIPYLLFYFSGPTHAFKFDVILFAKSCFCLLFSWNWDSKFISDFEFLEYFKFVFFWSIFSSIYWKAWSLIHVFNSF